MFRAAVSSLARATSSLATSALGTSAPARSMGYKLKTHKGAQKRFTAKASGFRRKGAGKSHGMWNKNRKVLRRLGKTTWVDKTNEGHIHKLLPNA